MFSLCRGVKVENYVGTGVEAEELDVKNRKWRELRGRYIFGLQEAE